MADANKPEQHEVIKGSRRPDGTYRKDVVRKAGYVPEDEQEKYHDKVLAAHACVPRARTRVLSRARPASPDAARRRAVEDFSAERCRWGRPGGGRAGAKGRNVQGGQEERRAQSQAGRRAAGRARATRELNCSP